MAPASQRPKPVPMRPAGVFRSGGPPVRGAVIRIGRGPLLRNNRRVSPTVLVVDDHAGFRSRARLLLETEGYEVVGEAADGQAAVEEARRLRPTWSFWTFSSLTRDGFDVAARITAEGSPPAVILHLEPRLVGLFRADRAQRGERLPAEGSALRRGNLGAPQLRSLRQALIGLGLVGFIAGVLSLVVALLERPPRPGSGRCRRLLSADRMVVHRDWTVRVVAAAGESPRRPDGGGRLRLVPRRSDRLGRAGPVRDRRLAQRSALRDPAAHAGRLPDGPARDPVGAVPRRRRATST